MVKGVFKYLKRFALFFSRPDFFSITLLWLMVLVVTGTVAQRYIGLYESQERYFSSFFFYGWFVPLPAGRLTLGLIFLGLLAKLAFKTNWVRSQVGIIIIHLGALILLGGGFLTAATSREGRMIIPEGESSDIIEDDRRMEFVLVEETLGDAEKEFVFGEGWLKKKQVLRLDGESISIQILDYFKNCEAVSRNEPMRDPDFVGFNKLFELKNIPVNKEEGENRHGILFKVSEGAMEKYYGIYELMPVTQTVEAGGKKYRAVIRHSQTKLPFSIELLDFEKKIYAGTDIAKSYQSQINLVLPTGREKYLIHMNHPLRYQEYSFYQASFLEGENGDTTVLAVVKNPGRIFPYVASIIMCLGLLLHLLSHLPRHFRTERK
jgi:hypothetical protein